MEPDRHWLWRLLHHQGWLDGTLDPSSSYVEAGRLGKLKFVGPGTILLGDPYTDYREMAEREAAHADGIDTVVIATPPQLHFPVAAAFLDGGIDVICEKPLC